MPEPLRNLERLLLEANPEGPGTSHAVNWLGDVQGLRILDIGGGRGALSIWLSSRGSFPVCCDVNPRRLISGQAEAENMLLRTPDFV